METLLFRFWDLLSLQHPRPTLKRSPILVLTKAQVAYNITYDSVADPKDPTCFARSELFSLEPDPILSL